MSLHNKKNILNFIENLKNLPQDEDQFFSNLNEEELIKKLPNILIYRVLLLCSKKPEKDFIEKFKEYINPFIYKKSVDINFQESEIEGMIPIDFDDLENITFDGYEQQELDLEDIKSVNIDDIDFEEFEDIKSDDIGDNKSNPPSGDEMNLEKVYYRLSYATISQFVFELAKKSANEKNNGNSSGSASGEIDAFRSNLQKVIDEENIEEEYIRKASKILDHFELCLYQYEVVNDKLYKAVYSIEKKVINASNQISQLSEYAQESTEKIEKISKKNKKTYKNLGKMESRLTGQVITVLSIFTGLSFVLFGGASILGDLAAFFEDSSENVGLGMVYLSIFGIILLGIIYVFLNFILIVINIKTPKEKIQESIGNTYTKYILIILLVIFIIGGILNSDMFKIIDNYFKYILYYNLKF